MYLNLYETWVINNISINKIMIYYLCDLTKIILSISCNTGRQIGDTIIITIVNLIKSCILVFTTFKNKIYKDLTKSVEKKVRYSDVPLAWGLYFQDGASPSFEGIVDLHNRIMFYLVVILFGVSWVMISIVWNFNKSRNKLVYRYLNHGKNVPIQKCSKFDNIILKSKIYISWRSYTTLSGNPLENNDINQVKVYEDVYDMRKDILKENKGKSGIYMLTTKLTNDTYWTVCRYIEKI